MVVHPNNDKILFGMIWIFYNLSDINLNFDKKQKKFELNRTPINILINLCNNVIKTQLKIVEANIGHYTKYDSECF